MHHYGHGTPTDHKLAVQYYQHAADSGYPLGQYNLGFMYHHGCGIPVDTAITLKYYQQSASQGYPRALYIMGYLYNAGIGVNKDKQEEVKYFKLAADKGHARAGIELSRMYESGNGVPRDYRLAVHYLLKAAMSSVDNKDAKASLTKIFSGTYTDRHLPTLNGEDYKHIAVSYLAEFWQTNYHLLHPNCQNAILELIWCMRNKEENSPPGELIWLMVPLLIHKWPETHFVLSSSY